MLEKVISGGQTGADQAGLYVASIYRIPTGGHCPQGYWTIFGPQPSLEEYGLQMTASASYPPRTRMNVANSDATIRLATNFNTAGERCTLSAIRQFDKPYLDLALDGLAYADKQLKLLQFLQQHRVKVLNVAGNADRDMIQGYHFRQAVALLTPVFQWFAK